MCTWRNSFLLGVYFLATTGLAQVTPSLSDQMKRCESAAPIPIEMLAGGPAEGKPIGYNQSFTMRIGLRQAVQQASVSVWVNGALQYVVDDSELKSFRHDGFGIRLSFATSVPTKEAQPKMLESGDFRLTLWQAQTNEVTVVATAVDGQQSMCGTYGSQYTMGSIDSYALVLGFNYSGLGGARELKYASTDAKAVALHLIGSTGIKPANLWLLTDDADMANKVPRGVNVAAIDSPPTFRKVLNEILFRADAQSNLYIYFSGHMLLPQNMGRFFRHGVSLYFPRSDEDDPGTLVDRIELLNAVSKAGFASTALILDACFSGRTSVAYGDGEEKSPRPTGAKSWRHVAVNRGLDDGRDPEFAGANIASSDGIEPSWELDEFKHGVFTYYLLNAGRGKEPLNLVDAYRDAKKQMAQLQPAGWKSKLTQQPTSRFDDAGLSIPWRLQP